jgi:hypothetical protein
MREAEQERAAAEIELGAPVPNEPISNEAIKALVEGLRDVLGALAELDPSAKAAALQECGLRPAYNPHRHTVVAEMDLGVHKDVSEGDKLACPTPLRDAPVSGLGRIELAPALST